MVDSLFIAIWTGALLLAAAALSLFAAMLVRRWLGGYWARRSTRLAMELAETLIVQMEAGALPSTRLRALIRHPRRTALAVIELSALVRGRDFERAMVALREVRAARRISRLLDKPGLDTRLMAIEAIGIVGGAGARRALQRAFETCPTLRETVAAAQALHGIGITPDLDRLLERVYGHRRGAPAELANLLLDIARADPLRLSGALDTGALHPSLQIQLVEALVRARAVSAIEAVRRSARADDLAVRAAGIKALGVLGGPGDSDILDEAARDGEPDIQALAAEAIGRLGLISLSSSLAEMLEAPHWEVRFQAGWALAQLGEAGIGRLKQIAAREGGQSGPHTAQMILAERQAA
ncbi:HEAT repeat domain-containing protein [Marinicauda sp. Alg238-R41]|uniref:HEAT repeat domain-containing protein n=1 Tax=Marinicauda sp. Alg238-R41 TaxID=2993447 RepID=UPI0022E217D3|nr:HEAT repeat domain-containing protein [Marinicauda sp. Alg238-R41]